jgi:nucleoside-diphosphate-sugar epimerase
MFVALTGANGFLGRRTADALKRAGHDVRALIRLERQRTSLEGIAREWVVGDQGDPETQVRLVSGAEALVHVAMDWKALNDGPVPNLERNMLGTLQLLEAARTAGVTQVVFVSSLDVYGQILQDRLLDEAHPTWPASLYGGFKAAIEMHLKVYHAAHKMNASSWRPATMYGLNPELDRSHWFDLVKQVKQGQTVTTDKRGTVVHVQDVADALALAVGDPAVSGEFVNLVDQDIVWRDVAEVARSLSRSYAPTIETRPIRGPNRDFAKKKAIDFFERHRNANALRRGMDGVQRYVGELLERIG